MTASDHTVRLDGTKGGVKPFPASDDQATNYEHMREFAAWAINNPASKASSDLKARLNKFYVDLRIAYETRDKRTNVMANLPSYDTYLELVDAYNDERGYTTPLRPEAPNADENAPRATQSSQDDRPAWVDELISAIHHSNQPRRPSWRERWQGSPANASLQDVLHGNNPQTDHPDNQPQATARPARRRH